MNHTSDTTAAGNGGNFGPQQAAALLNVTTRQARRRLEPAPPLLLVIRAVMVLAACGAIWLSVRGQHPYSGPTAADIPVLVAFVVLNFAVAVVGRKRATAGVSGRTPLRPAEIAILTVVWVGAFAVMGVLAGTGASHAFVYGQYLLTVPLIAAGLAWAAIMAARADWSSFGTGLGVAVVGGARTFAGPAGAWAVAGVGFCVVLLGSAAARLLQQRRIPVRP